MTLPEFAECINTSTKDGFLGKYFDANVTVYEMMNGLFDPSKVSITVSSTRTDPALYKYKITPKDGVNSEYLSSLYDNLKMNILQHQFSVTTRQKGDSFTILIADKGE